MSLAFNQQELYDEYESHSINKNKILEDLLKIISAFDEPLEGNSIYEHNTLNLKKELYTKQVNLFWCGKQASKRICEIGFNAGHSAMLMLLGQNDTPLDFTIFEFGYHSYTKPCFEYLKSYFNNINFEFVEGDSTITMQDWIGNNQQYNESYDLIHLDGGHQRHIVIKDFTHADILLKIGGILIIDDTDIDYINEFTDLCIGSGTYKELEVLKTEGYPHRILQKVTTSLK
jgi:hypothetical protein